MRSPSYCWLRLLIWLASVFAWAIRLCRLGIGSAGTAPPLGRTRLASATAPITVTARAQARPDLMRAFRGPLGTYLRGRKCSTQSPFASPPLLAPVRGPRAVRLERDHRWWWRRALMGPASTAIRID